MTKILSNQTESIGSGLIPDPSINSIPWFIEIL